MNIIVKNGHRVFTFEANINPHAVRNIREMLEVKKDFTTLKVVVLEHLPEYKQDETLAALAEIEAEIQKDSNSLTFELVV